MSTPQAAEPTPRKPLRLWPGVVLVVLLLLGWFVVPKVAPEATMYGVLGGLLCGPALVVWWAFFSRAPRVERWGAVVLVVLAMAVTPRFLHVSVARGNMGFQFVGNAIPVLSLAFVVWAVASRRLADGLRRAAMVGTILLAKPIDARPAREGEVVVTVIKGEKETQNRAARGDWVVRNRCPETGNEQYTVRADKFAARYEKTESTPAGGWQEFRPVGKEMRYYILPRDTEPFTFMAPWNEPMLARPGDAIVQDPQDEKDVYRVEAAAFACTYEIVKGPVPPS
jgi:hypothetical protein